jgi:hypothetical protein
MYLNLSRQPFSNRRLFWICLLAVFCASLILAFWTATQKAQAESEINLLHRQVDDVQARIKILKEKSVETTKVVPQTVLTDEQKYQLASARQLINRKNFSWNNLLSDIEKHVPKQVRILSIKIAEGVKEADAGAIEVDITAAGKTAAQMTEMMADLENSSGKFVVDQSEQQAMSDEGDVPFTLRVLYRPRGGE